MNKSSMLAAWIRLAQGVVAADNRFLEVEEELCFALTRSSFKATDEEIARAKDDALKITIEDAAETIATLNDQVQRKIMHGLLSIAIVDGELHRNEGCFLASLAGKFGIEVEALNTLFFGAKATNAEGSIVVDAQLGGRQ